MRFPFFATRWTNHHETREIPEDITGLIAFLASKDTSYINGTTISVDSGMNMS